jgi:hypothetical protein
MRGRPITKLGSFVIGAEIHRSRLPADALIPPQRGGG